MSIITNEIIPPFNKEPHDYQISVMVNIQKKIKEESEFLKELIQKCCDANPENRPTSLVEKIYTKQIDELEELSYDFTE